MMCFLLTPVITKKLSQEMRCKIAIFQEAYGLVRQTQRLLNRKYGINSTPNMKLN